jgi:purine catabolism regulator
VLTLTDVLAMPVVRTAGPRVLAGGERLGRPVRWVHTSELPDIGPLLREGDLLLSTGIAMPDSDEALAQFVASLADSGTCGLVIELGRRWRVLPEALVGACESNGLPLVALTREVRFAAIAQAIGERIVDQQLLELRETQRVHETFTELGIAEAGPNDILEAVQRLAGTAVVLESEQHHVLDYRAGAEDVSALLADWTARSKRVVVEGRTVWDEELGWLVTRVGKRDRGWGRLIVLTPDRPTERQIAMAERAAAALALHRLHDRQRDSLIRRTHHELLVGLLNDPTSADLVHRCEAAGLPTNGRQFVGVALRPLVNPGSASRASRLDEVTAATVHVASELKMPALISDIDGDVRALVSLSRSANPNRLVDDLAKRVRQRHEVVVSAGRPAERAFDIDRTLREARQVADAVRPHPSYTNTVHRLDDVGLRGLLALLSADERVRLYVQRQLSALREHDAQWNSALEGAVTALLTHPTSKSEAAASLHVSRPVFYDRLAKAERVLGVSLDDPDVRVSLHFALVADEMTRSGD